MPDAEQVAGDWIARFVRDADDALLLAWALADALPAWDGVTPLAELREADGDWPMSRAAARILSSRLEAAEHQLEAGGSSVAEAVARYR